TRSHAQCKENEGNLFCSLLMILPQCSQERSKRRGVIDSLVRKFLPGKSPGTGIDRNGQFICQSPRLDLRVVSHHFLVRGQWSGVLLSTAFLAYCPWSKAFRTCSGRARTAM